VKTQSLVIRLNRFGLTVAVGIIVALGVSITATTVLRVGGPIYDRIVLGKDLIGDILPPPEYVLEAYLETTQAMQDPTALGAATKKLQQLHKDYDDRKAYWAGSGLPSNLKDILTTKSDSEVQKFWSAVEGRLLPSLKRGDKAGADAAYADAKTAYKAHRALIDELVTGATTFNSQMEQLASLLNWAALIGIGVAVLSVMWLLWRGIRSFRTDAVDPVVEITETISKLAAGNLEVSTTFGNRDDEVGLMAKAIEVFRTNALQAEAQRAEQDEYRADQAEIVGRAAEQQKLVVEGLARRLHALAEGNLDSNIGEFFPEEYKRLRMDFNQAISELSSALTEIRDSSNNVAAAASELGNGASELARRAEHQAATLEETAAAHDEITATVAKTLKIAKETSTVVSAAKVRAEGSRHVVSDAIAAISTIEQSSREISQIIGVIDEIAFQTNLLALNAGVEAARAGDAGRGFAVVAQEVRALSQRSSAAAKQIRELITGAEKAVGEGVKLVGATGVTLNQIVDEVSDIAARVQQIAASSAEEALGLEEVNKAIGQLDMVTQQNAAIAEQSAAASQGPADEAERLVSLVSRFQISGSNMGKSPSIRAA
jgi:methyl-accepting chemotaxis protein